tara:strand:+ start:186 stop:512 length:327 start_codon:yes stop_codon:yes gene_type:complete
MSIVSGRRIIDDEGNETWELPEGVIGSRIIEYTEEQLQAEAWIELREERNMVLKQLDKYQGVLLYNSLTEEQQQELATYRTALLDLPAAYDNPEDCYTNFPTKPSWMI